MTAVVTSQAEREVPEPVRQAARTGEPDRYLAAVLAPRPVQGDLIALAAFAAEIARIPDLVSDPTIGETRLAWWREALEKSSAGGRTGNIVADALRDARERHELSTPMLLTLVDARAALLYQDPPDDDPHLARFFTATEGSLLTLASQIVAPELARSHATEIDKAGQIYGSARMLIALPRMHARGRTLLPADRLAVAGLQANDLTGAAAAPGLRALTRHYRDETRVGLAHLRAELKALPRALRTVFLPLALVEPYLRASERFEQTEDPRREQLMPLIRIYRLWTAHAFGRF